MTRLILELEAYWVVNLRENLFVTTTFYISYCWDVHEKEYYTHPFIFPVFGHAQVTNVPLDHVGAVLKWSSLIT